MKLKYWGYLIWFLLLLCIFYLNFETSNKINYIDMRMRNTHDIIYIKHDNPEVEKCTKDIEKYFFAVPWKGKFGIKYYDYYEAVINNIAEIVEHNGFKKNEYGMAISLYQEPNTKEIFIFLQVKLYKTGYKGQYYTEWYISEHGGKAPKDLMLPSIPFREPRKNIPKKPLYIPKGKSVYI